MPLAETEVVMLERSTGRILERTEFTGVPRRRYPCIVFRRVTVSGVHDTEFETLA